MVASPICKSASPPTLNIQYVAIATPSHRRSARSGSVMRVRCHCQPARFVILNPCSIQARIPYQQASQAAKEGTAAAAGLGEQSQTLTATMAELDRLIG